MWNVQIGNVYEVWFKGVPFCESVLLKVKGTKLVFMHGALENTEIDALRRVK